MRNKKKLYLEYLRAFAILAVVTVHAISRSIRPIDSGEISYRIGRALVVAGQWAVPIFIMISGSVFLSLDRDVPISKIYGKYLPRMAAAYLFWSFIYTMVFSTMRYYNILSIAAVWNTLTGTLAGGSAHLWYMWLILGLYMLTPILRSCVMNASPGLMRYWMVISFLFVSCAPLLRNISGIEEVFGENLTILNSAFFGGYVFYFVLGHYLDSVKLDSRTRGLLYILGFVGALVASCAAFFYTDEKSGFAVALWDNLSPYIVFSSAALFVAVKYHSPEKPMHAVLYLADHSFGIYLTHNLFLDSLGRGLIALLSHHVSPLLIALLLTPCALVFGTVLSVLIRRIKPIGRFII
jgi:surface polysaccharide O-acyltransferase-like enzyme